MIIKFAIAQCKQGKEIAPMIALTTHDVTVPHYTTKTMVYSRGKWISYLNCPGQVSRGAGPLRRRLRQRGDQYDN